MQNTTLTTKLEMHTKNNLEYFGCNTDGVFKTDYQKNCPVLKRIYVVSLLHETTSFFLE